MCAPQPPRGTSHGFGKIQYVRAAWNGADYEYRSDPQDIIQRALSIPGTAEVDTIIELYAADSPKAEYKWDGETKTWHLVNKKG
jgi:hypothetical protein